MYCFRRKSRTSEAECRTGDVLSLFGPGQPFGGVSSMQMVMALGTASTSGMTFDRWLAGGHRYKSICYSDATAVSGRLLTPAAGHFSTESKVRLLFSVR